LLLGKCQHKCTDTSLFVLSINFDNFYRQHVAIFLALRAMILLNLLTLMSSTSFGDYLDAGTTHRKLSKMGKIQGRPACQ
jgi:hypothetical protein